MWRNQDLLSLGVYLFQSHKHLEIVRALIYQDSITDEELKAQNLVASLGATTHFKAVTINHVILFYCLILFQEIYRKVRSILNKLTPQKFQTLTQQSSELEIDTLERLEGVIDLIFEKVCTVVLV